MWISDKLYGGRHKLLLCLLAVAFASSCKDDSGYGRGVYFWKSNFELNGYERSFLKEHGIGTLYMKFFDVALERDWDRGGELSVQPVATVGFRSEIPEGVELVPAVYITLDALRFYGGRESELAHLIIKRIFAMASYNELPAINRVQFDCDWTESTRDSYFKLCDCAREELSRRGVVLSGTVRLHQLKQKNFPFDCPVLMVYNTGLLKDSSTVNSILDASDVEKYLRRKMKIRSRMDIAYPAYAWGVLLRDGSYSGLLHLSDFSDTSLFAPSVSGRYVLLRDTLMDGRMLLRGDEVRPESSEISQILRCKQILKNKLSYPAGGELIIYHLDSANLHKYSYDEIESIYSR